MVELLLAGLLASEPPEWPAIELCSMELFGMELLSIEPLSVELLAIELLVIELAIEPVVIELVAIEPPRSEPPFFRDRPRMIGALSSSYLFLLFILSPKTAAVA